MDFSARAELKQLLRCCGGEKCYNLVDLKFSPQQHRPLQSHKGLEEGGFCFQLQKVRSTAGFNAGIAAYIPHLFSPSDSQPWVLRRLDEAFPGETPNSGFPFSENPSLGAKSEWIQLKS